MNIGELATQAHVKVDTIRYYEKRQLMPQPNRTTSGYRSYTRKDLKLLLFILHAKKLGFTLEEIKGLLSLKTGQPDCAKVRAFTQKKSLEIAARIHDLSRIKDVLDDLSEQCEQQNDDSCPILRSLEDI